MAKVSQLVVSHPQGVPRLTTICFSSDTRQLRLNYCLILTIASSLCLGLASGIGKHALLGIFIARLLLGLGLSLLPQTSAGRLRPLLSLLLAVILASTFATGLPPVIFLVALLMVSLGVDLQVESITLRWSIESELCANFALLYPTRYLGLLLGFSAQATSLLTQVDIHRSQQALLALLLTLVFLSREREEDTILRPRIRKSNIPPKVQVTDSFTFLRSPRSLESLSLLILTAALGGILGVRMAPDPLLGHVGGVWSMDLPTLGIAIVLVCVLSYLTESVSLIALTLSAYSLLIGHLILAQIGRWPMISRASLEAIAIFCCLLAYRWVVHHWHRGVDELRAALLPTIWTVAYWGAKQWGLAGETTVYLIATMTLGLGTLGIAAHLCRAESHRLVTSHKPLQRPVAVVSERGYQEFDTTEAPPKKRKRRPGLKGVADWLLVGFPVNVIVGMMIATVITTAWHALDHHEEWRLAIRDGWYTTRTELFLDSLSDRVEEEILVTNKVPSDWEQFVQSNFGKPEAPAQDVDAWGTRLSFQEYPKFVEIRSAGRDRKLNTLDDIVKEASKKLEEGEAL